MKQKPLAVHNDGRIFVIEKHHKYYQAEDQLNKFATLQKAPANLHTYKLDKDSLWSVAFMDVKVCEILEFLAVYSVNLVPERIKTYIKDEINSFWTMELYIDKDYLSLKGNPYAEKRIFLIDSVKKMIFWKEENIRILRVVIYII